MTTNAAVELEIAQQISNSLRKLKILPEGYHCEVRLRRGNRKKRKDAAFEWNWDPNTDSVWISFSPLEENEAENSSAASSFKSPNLGSTDDRLSDLIRALDRAEGRPGYEFVSLKWFRDTALTHEGFAWAADEFARHDALREAIDRRWILTSKVANPRPPNFPVTAIRLNRQMPEVNAVLGIRSGGPSAFRPITIRGESLSETVLRDRR